MTDALDTRPDHEIAAEKLEALIKREGLTIAATFVPFSRSRNAKPGKDGKLWRSLNWRVDVLRQGRDVNTLAPAGPVHVILASVDYAQGEGHTPTGKKTAAQIETAARALGRMPKTAREMMISHEIETGRMARGFSTMGLTSGNAIDPPSAADVLSSLLNDGGAVDYASFDDWASDYGYDTDSREAEAIYRACLAHGLALRASLGNDVFAEARDLATSL